MMAYKVITQAIKFTVLKMLNLKKNFICMKQLNESWDILGSMNAITNISSFVLLFRQDSVFPKRAALSLIE